MSTFGDILAKFRAWEQRRADHRETLSTPRERRTADIHDEDELEAVADEAWRAAGNIPPS